ncbi:hypothetical protein QQS21_009701 [Conoideocrella luteorostrata]|uniref:Uncharacterized protein n=1 Tax=Conoideocrella luteorostrata TaxID=1105319 RepID=A0AAJ0CJ54_9HYPO|nr:hypothetical protein QQS21_009701 [Conoideocrella luteorostrata]
MEETKPIDSTSSKPTEQQVEEHLEEFSRFIWHDCDSKQRHAILPQVWERIFGWRYQLPSADRGTAFGTARLIYEERYDSDCSGFGDYNVPEIVSSASECYQNSSLKRGLPASDAGDDSPNKDDQESSSQRRVLGSGLASPSEALCDLSDELPDAFHVDIRADAYRVKGIFLSLWINGNFDIYERLQEFIDRRNLESKKSSPGIDTEYVFWDDGSLYTAKNTPGLQLSTLFLGRTPHDAEGFRATKRISSQLLFYRLVAVFGMPPSSETKETDDYKSVWQYTLCSIDDMQDENINPKNVSKIVFMDYKDGEDDGDTNSSGAQFEDKVLHKPLKRHRKAERDPYCISMDTDERAAKIKARTTDEGAGEAIDDDNTMYLTESSQAALSGSIDNWEAFVSSRNRLVVSVCFYPSRIKFEFTLTSENSRSKMH